MQHVRTPSRPLFPQQWAILLHNWLLKCYQIQEMQLPLNLLCARQKITVFKRIKKRGNYHVVGACERDTSRRSNARRGGGGCGVRAVKSQSQLNDIEVLKTPP